MNRLPFVLGLALVFPVSTFATERPNVLVLLVDDLGYGDLSSYGATDLKSPHVDALMSRGMKFTNFYANCPVCSPTRAALLAGTYQDLVGVQGVIRTFPESNWGFLARDAVLLPTLMQKAGYHTALVGKWHLGLRSPNTPNERGFDHVHGWLGDMMDDYFKHRRHGFNYMRRNDETIDPKGHATELFTEWAIDYLTERKQAEEPFFLYLAYNAPHTPIQPPEDWFEKVKAREPGITDRRAKLVALIEHMDDGIGRVLAALEKNGQAENTIVVFSSDNGGQLNVGANNGPLRDGKQSVYEGGLKVPTCVVWPGHVEAGTVSEFQAMSMDVLPTVFDAIDLEIPHRVEGRSFLPTLRGESQAPLREFTFFRRREGGPRYGGKTIEAVRWGDWKLLQNSPFEPQELYNLKTDPREEQNVIARERTVYNKLASAQRIQLQRYGAVPWQRPSKRGAK